MFSKKAHNSSKRSEDVKKSAGKVVDPKRDTPTRAKHLRLFLDNAEPHEIISFFETYYSHIFYIVYDAFISAEINLRQKGAHKAQREELEAVLYLFEKILIFLPEHLARKWQYHSVGRLMSKLLHPGNSWKLLKREAMRLFLLWYQILGDVAGEPLHAMFATLVPGFPSPYQGLGLTALAAMTPDTQDGPINPAEICPLIPPQSGERWRSPDTDLTRIFLDVLLELIVSQITLIEWKEHKHDKHKRCFNFLFDKFKTFYMHHIFPDFNWSMSLYRPSLELPEVRKFRPAFVDNGDGTKKMDPMLSCRVVVIKWVAQFTHLTRSTGGTTTNSTTTLHSNVGSFNDEENELQNSMMLTPYEESTRNTIAGVLVREILYGSRENVNFVHEVYRQAFLLSFSHSPAIKKVISVYKDWIQMNVPELPPFLLEPITVDKEREDFRNVMQGKLSTDDLDANAMSMFSKTHLVVRAGLQNVLQIFITNAANVFLLEVSSEYPILLEEQVEMCKRVLNIYRYMVMNVKMEARTWEQLLFILLQITQLTLPEAPPRRREDTLGGRLAQAIFQTLIVTWIKANLYVVVSTELWDQFLEVLSSLTMWEELIREWAKTMETLTRVLARQVYQLDLNDLPLDRLSERATKKRRGRQAPQETKYSHAIKSAVSATQDSNVNSQAHSIEDGGSGTESMVNSSVMSQSSGVMSMRKRVNSESEYKCQSARRRRPRQKIQIIRSLSESNINGKLRAVRQEVARMDKEFLTANKRRHKSADSLYNFSRYSGSEAPGSRSSSPAPSSGLEYHSMKESPMQLDHDSISESGMSDHLTTSHHNNSSHLSSNVGMSHADHMLNQGHNPRSVMSGGTVKGWLPDVAVVLWRRMLGALGNINHINDTVIHAQIYKYLIELLDILVKIRNNQGVSIDNMIAPQPPDFVPPFTIFAPWCFRALNLPDAYQRGKLYALRLLCLFTCRQHDNPLPKTHLVQFYKVLHEGLTSQKDDVLNTLVRFTGPRFFSLMLPGYTAYILDFLYATNCVISTSELKGVPRTEATSVVGALLAFPAILNDVPLLLPNAHELSLISSADVKDQIIGVLLKSGKREPAGLARCISLSSLGIFVYSELIQQSFHPKIKEAIQVLLTALRFNNKAVAQIASDMLLLLSDHVKSFLNYYPEVPKKIVEVLARTLVTLAPRGDVSVGDDEKRLLLSILLALGEWCMRIPNYVLTQPQEDGRSLLYHVFGALQMTCSPSIIPSPMGPDQHPRREGKQFESFPTSSKQAYMDVTKTVLSPAVMVADFDPNIHVDNTKEGSYSNSSSPLKAKSNHTSRENVSSSEEKQQQNNLTLHLTSEADLSCPIRLAARTMLSHLINYLFHFPMSIGASCLSSMVSEQDDIARFAGKEELTMDVFKADNIQFFILNDTTLISFVELPALEIPGLVPGVQMNRSQARIILRDLSGKFCWDSSCLYGVRNDLSAESPIFQHHEYWPNGETQNVSKTSMNKVTISLVSPPRQTVRHRGKSVLPTIHNSEDDLDNLDDLLQYITYSSPECLEDLNRPLNAVSSSVLLNDSVENEVITAVLNQRNAEQDQAMRKTAEGLTSAKEHSTSNSSSLQIENPTTVFHQCRKLFNQLGLASWERRPNIHLIKKNEKLLREIKNLDSKRGREAHKIAVIYVGEGQEDKQSILSNASGSQAYEDFVSGLAWEVELETHNGFMGGLKRTKTTGETAPYFATSFMEVMFHVATRMPSNSEESMLSKTRHIGNDEIHIVWSEHWRDYRRGILPTEFCDVLIVIYPLKNKLFRIQVSKKPEVPYFGPLFNEMIVDQRVLPGLVRATAINASRAKRSMLTYYQNHYEERYKALENIIKQHKEATTFEDFITQVYSPAPLANLYQSSSTSRPSSVIGSSSLGSQQLSYPLNSQDSGSFSNSSRDVWNTSSNSAVKSKVEITHTLSSPTGFGPQHGNMNFSDEDMSPRSGKKTFRSSPGSRRPMVIKEEPGLPEHAITNVIPTRKR